MRKNDPVYLGDKIVTNKHFKPIMADKEAFDLKEEFLDGVVVATRGDFFCVDFGKEFPFTHSLEKTLKGPTGYAVNRRDFKVVESYSTKDPKKSMFINVLRERQYTEAQKAPSEIEKIRQSAESKVGSIKQYVREIKNYESNLLKDNFKIKALEAKPGVSEISNNTIERQYEKLLSHKKIKTAEIIEKDNGNKYILVTTEDLTFHDEYRDIPDFVLGAYKMLIPINNGNGLKIVNYKKHVLKEYYHPCIVGSNICMGNMVGDEIHRFNVEDRYLDTIYLMLNFLEEPDYGTPHLCAIKFMCGQNVTINPRNQFNWFDMGYWKNKEVWDGNKYTTENKEAYKKHTGGRLGTAPAQASNERCPSCGEHAWDGNRCIECGFLR